MQQCKQVASDPQELQQRFLTWHAAPGDGVGVLPTGLSWFDVLPLSMLLQSPHITVVVYPNQTSIQYHLASLQRLEQLNPEMAWDRLAAFLPDMPAHAERDLWERVHRGKLSIIMLTAKKLQAITTLSQLTRHAFIEMFIVEQGHLIIPNLWGPTLSDSYSKLSGLFQTAWPNRPRLLVLSQPVPQQYYETIQSKFQLTGVTVIEKLPDFGALQLTVYRAITQYQKQKTLEERLRISAYHEGNLNIVVCPTLKALTLLEKRLKGFPIMVLHSQLSINDISAKLTPLCEVDAFTADTVILVEQAVYNLLPMHLFEINRLQIVYWELPWSLESMLQQCLISAGLRPLVTLQISILYAKEDYTAQRHSISHYAERIKPIKRICMDHLNRVRHFCAFLSSCRIIHLKNILFGYPSDSVPCYHCDQCRQPSTVWRNLIAKFIY